MPTACSFKETVFESDVGGCVSFMVQASFMSVFLMSFVLFTKCFWLLLSN